MKYFQEAFKKAFHSAVFWSFSTTLLRAGGFFLVMAYALQKLSAEDMGLWYVLTNMAGLAGMVEMGFNTAISRTASYFMGGALTVPVLGKVRAVQSTQETNFAALAGLVIMSRQLYRRFALLVGLLLFLGGGMWLTLAKPGMLHGTGPWLAYMIVSLGTTVNMLSLFWWPLLFGLNRVREYNQLQIRGLLIHYLFAFFGLRLGAGLPALAMGNFLLNYIPRHVSRRRVLEAIPDASMRHPQSVSWRQLWPITWRTGLASLASYFMMGITTMACAHLFNLSITARYGLCLQFGLMLHSLAQSWMVVKYPLLSALRTQGRSKEFNAVVYQRILLSLLTYLSGAAIVLMLATPFLEFIHSKTMPLPPEQFFFILLATGADLFINLLAAVIITSENSTPHLHPYIVSGIGVTVACFILGSSYGLWGIILAPLLVQSCLNYWWMPLQCWRVLQRHTVITAS